MTRTTPRNGEIVELQQKMQVYTELMNRALLASRLGQSYDGDRDLYQALGYPVTDIRYTDYYGRYRRQDIANAIINRPVNATWQGELELVESNDPKETDFEKAWRDLNRKLGLKTRFARIDRLTGIGRYGILLLGFGDTPRLEDFSHPVTKVDKLMYVKPFSEDIARIRNWVEKSTDERYGLPLTYDIQITDQASNVTSSVEVHYSRIIHITDGTLESEVYGIPRLEAIYNRLMDIEKLAGGDAEMFWRGARPGYSAMVDKDFAMTSETKQDLKEQVDEFENNLRRIMVNEGVDLKALAQQIADPSTHMDTQLKMVSAQTGIPLRILTGSERGQLASSEDRSEWLSYVQTRREEHAEPRILRPFVDYMIKLEILPKPEDDYEVEWSDLFAQSEVLRVEIGQKRANAIREYTTNPMAMEVIPPSAFMEKCLGLNTDDIELVKAIRDAEMMEEVKLIGKVNEIIGPAQSQRTQGSAPNPGSKTNFQKGVSKKPRQIFRATV